MASDPTTASAQHPGQGTPPVGPTGEQTVLTLMQAEFGAIRTEIGRLIDHQRELQNLSLVSLGAVLAFMGVMAELKEGEPARLRLVLLLVPFLTLQFALTAADLSRRIIELGSYIEHLASEANAVVAVLLPVAEGSVRRTEPIWEGTIWGWESWKRSRYEDRARPMRVLVVLLDKTKWLSLLLPGLVAVVSYLVLDPDPWSSKLERWLLLVGLFVLSVSAVLLTVYPSEARGVRTSRATDRSGRSIDA